MDWSIITTFAGFVATSLITFGSLVWWLAGQFTGVRNLVYKKAEDILNKLEYHEKHDDDRFAELRNEIWEIRLRNAVQDGHTLKKKLEEGK